MADQLPGEKARPRPPRRPLPQRTCVACRGTATKRELVRIVRTADGRVAIDPTGKQAGRGSYLCRSRRCWDLALKRQLLDQALKTTASAEDRARLAEFARGLPDERSDE